MENRVRRVVVPLFKGDEKSFPFWKKRMEQHLKQEGLLHTLERTPIEEDYSQPGENETAEQEAAREEKMATRLKEDDTAVNEFWLALNDDAMGQVFQCKYAKDIMLRLVDLYQSRGAVAMLELRTRLYTLRTERFASLKHLFTAHQELVQQLESIGEVIPHVEVINTLLVAIPECYKHVLGALSVIRRKTWRRCPRSSCSESFSTRKNQQGRPNPEEDVNQWP